MKKGITKAAVDHAKEILRLYADQNPSESPQPAAVSEGKITKAIENFITEKSYSNDNGAYIGDADLFEDGFRTAIEWLQSLNQKGEGWIKDKQPKIPKGVKDIEVLALNGDGLIIDCWFEKDWQFYDCEGSNITDSITHWMPLPPKPEGGKR